MLREIQKMKIDAYGCGHSNDIKPNLPTNSVNVTAATRLRLISA